MKKVIRSLFLFLFILAICLIPHIVIPEGNNSSELQEELSENVGGYDEKSIILQNVTTQEVKKIADRLNAKYRITSDEKFATLTLLGDETILDVVENSKNEDIVDKIFVDYQVSLFGGTEYTTQSSKITPNDKYYKKQNYLDYLNLGDVWNYVKGTGIQIAVIDTGIDVDHPEFSGRISEYSYNASEDKIVKDYVLTDGTYDWSLIDDEQGHGTAVAGVMAASMNNRVGITGIAPNAELLVIKADCNEDGTFKRSSDLVFGLYYAIERSVDVVNMSFGGSKENIFSDATKLAVDNDVICVAAAGNEGSTVSTYPAADPNVICVGALDDNSYELAAYSNFGENVDIVAPGTVYTTKNNGEYDVVSGTSFASPIVASTIALQIEKDKNSYVSQYREFEDKTELLYASCKDLGDLGKDFYYGYGALDVTSFVVSSRLTVTFDYLTDEIEKTQQVFIKNNALQNIPLPERNYAVFDGWYYDIQCQEEYQLYQDKWATDITLYCNWVTEDDTVPFEYSLLDDGTINILNYIGKRKYISIPDYIDGREVSTIGANAFANNTELRVITLPNYLKTIEGYAFRNCSNLTSVTIPNTVESIGMGAFLNNIRLNNINFEEESNLVSIGVKAFAGCSNLKRIDLPKTMENIDGSAFYSCSDLKQINVENHNNKYISVDGVLFTKSKNTLVAYPAGKEGNNYTLPKHVKKLGDYAFACSKIQSLGLSNITSIGAYCFQFSQIESVELSDKVNYLGEYAFSSCTNLKNVKLGKGISKIPNNCFELTSLKNIVIPNNIVTIGEGAFRCSIIANVEFEERSQLQSIEKSAFAYTKIEQFDLPANVMVLGESSFEQSKLTQITFSSNSNLVTIGEKAFSGTLLSEINLPKNLTIIGDEAFENTLLVEVTLPANLKKFLSNVFADCEQLENIYVDKNNPYFNDVDGVVYTKDLKTIHAYPVGRSTTTYKILDGTLNIGDYAFYTAAKLTGLEMPTSLQSIGIYSVSGCNNLTSISVPDNVVQISNYAFYENYNMRSVNFGKLSKLDRLSYSAFAYTGIYNFTVPSNVSSISQNVFYGCSSLSKVTFSQNSQIESISSNIFNGCDNLRTIVFENGSKLKTLSAHAFEGMSNLETIDFGDAKIETIGNYAFRYNTKLKSFQLPSTVDYIGRYAFFGCKALTDMNIPSSVEYIGRFAFNQTNEINLYFEMNSLPLGLEENWDYGLKGYYVGVKEVFTEGDYDLAVLLDDTISIVKYNGSELSVDLNDLAFGQITQIGAYAFAGSSINEIILPSSLRTIERYAFSNTDIENIIIPSGVTQIGDYAFQASNLYSVEFEGTSNIVRIGYNAFANTYNLEEITLPKTLRVLGNYAFINSGLKSVVFEEGIKLEEINKGVFQNTKLVTVSIPSNVKLINDYAFKDIETLQSVSFNTTNLQIRSNVFYNTGLVNVYIGENVEYIGEFSFTGLRKLESFSVNENNPYYQSIDGVLYSKDGRKLIAFPGAREGTFVIPSHVEILGFGSFENTKLTTVLFDENINLLSIGCRTFYGSNLRSIVIPDSVISIDYYAFAMSKNLESVVFGKNSKLSGIYEGAFYGCVNLEHITLPDNIYEISNYAFASCLSLKEIPISSDSKILGIYDYAFQNSGLETIEIPTSLIDIGKYAFQGVDVKEIVILDSKQEELIIGFGAFADCNDLETITLPFIGASLNNEAYSWFGYIFGAGSYEANELYVPSSLKHVIITEGQTFVGIGAFMDLENLETIQLPASINRVRGYAFSNTYASYELLNPITINQSSFMLSWFGSGIEGTLHIQSTQLKTLQSFSETGLNIDYIYIPKTVTSLSGLENSEFLKEIYFEEGSELTYISSLEGCSSLEKIVIPSGINELGYRFFAGCTNLTKVIFAEDSTLDTIYDEAFSNCDSLESIIIPSNVTTIGYESFESCDNLRTVTFEEGSKLETIDRYAFCNCKKLESITIPSSVTNIGSSAFGGCNNLESVIFKEGIKLETISDSTFSSAGLKSITIPDSVRSIGYGAFWGCSSLTSIEIPEGVTTIENNAFYDCKSLKTVIISDSVTTINAYAFFRCSSLESVKLPSKITTIPNQIFYGCSSLKNIVIPEGVTSIGEHAFSNCTNLANIVVPESLTTIGTEAFYATNIVYIENNSDLVFEIGKSTHGYIASKAITIVNKDGIKTYGDGCIEKDNFVFKLENGKYKLINYIGTSDTAVLPLDINGNSYTVYHMKGLKNVIIPEGTTKIDQWAFENVLDIETIVIPEGVKYIGSSAFSGCSNLTSIVLPSTITSVGFSGFRSVDNLENVYYNGTIEEWCKIAFEDSNSNPLTYATHFYMLDENNEYYEVKEIVIPDSIDTIKSYQFYKFEGLEKITLSNSVKTIGANSFEGCCAEFVGNEKFVYENGILYDGDRIVYINAGAKNIVLKNTLSSVSSNLFKNCTNLKRIIIPSSVTSIGSSAFENCSSLEEIIFEEGSQLTTIGSYAFRNCSNLRSIVIPEGVTSIGSYVFFGCSELTSIVIPDSVTSIGTDVFNNCSNLENVVLSKNITTIGTYSFYNCSSLSNIVIPEGVTSIGTYAFYNCSSLSNIVIPEGVTSIGTYAFYNCGNLESIVIPSSVKTIGNSAFYNCKKLESVIFEKGSQLTTIGSDAFYGCSSLESVEIPDCVKTIDYYAFYNCSNLQKVILPASLEKVGNNAFVKLKYVYYKGNIETWFNINWVSVLSKENIYFINSDGKYAAVEKVKIPENVTIIPDCAFYAFTDLKEVEIPESVTTIGRSAFSDCTNLESVILPESVTSIGVSAFSGCSLLRSVNIPTSVTSVGANAFSKCTNLTDIYIDDLNALLNMSIGAGMSSSYNLYVNNELLVDLVIPEGVTTIKKDTFRYCASIKNVTIPSSVTAIETNAFYECNNLIKIINNSDLPITLVSANYGMVAYRAQMIIDKEGNKIFKSGSIVYVEKDDFLFKVYNGTYTLIAYLGVEETVTLPVDIMGNTYTMDSVKGLVNVIIPEGITKLPQSAFYNCSTLKSVVLADSVTTIESGVFTRCVNLESITFGSNIQTIKETFKDTKLYSDPTNWIDGALYIDNALIKVDSNTKYYKLPDYVKVVAQNAFAECYLLETIETNNLLIGKIGDCSNLKTLILNNFDGETTIFKFFNSYSSSSIPITLKSILIRNNSNVKLNSLLAYISDVDIFVEYDKYDVMWDYDYPNWHNKNKVYYSEEWITTRFYDHDNNLLVEDYYGIDQIIRQPIMNSINTNKVVYNFIGWDLDNDGEVDSYPATSNVDLVAYPIYSSQELTYVVTYYDIDGTTILYKQIYNYGDEILLKDAPNKKGYQFLGWNNYPLDMIVREDISVYSMWKHEGVGHIYNITVVVEPTCTEDGYTKHICSICDDVYNSDIVEKIGHTYKVEHVEPTCTEPGYDLYYCNCGHNFKDNYIDEIGHTFGEWITEKESTCEEEGLKYRLCDCGEMSYETLPLLDHNLTERVLKEATCLQTGKVEYECDMCHNKFIESTPMTDHIYVKKYTSKTILQILLDKILNIFFGYEGDKFFYYECSHCGHIRSIAETKVSQNSTLSGACQHTHTGLYLEVEATCQAEGLYLEKCEQCEKVISFDIIPTIGHIEVIDEAVLPTCTETGLTEGKHCLNCSEVLLEQSVIEALGHRYDEFEVCERCNALSDDISVDESIRLLFADYYNNGSYVKETKLNILEDVAQEVSYLFHNAQTIKYRQTFYEMGMLTMFTSKDGNIYADYSRYEDKNGKVYHTGFGGNWSVNWTSVEDQFTTLNDFKSSSLDGWTFENGVYTYYLIPTTSTSEHEMTKMAREFVAPMWYCDYNYVIFSKLTVEIKGDKLVMNLYVTSEDIEGKLDNAEGIFSTAIITKSEQNCDYQVDLEFGINDGEQHIDGTLVEELNSYVVDKYTLTVLEAKNVYDNAFDAQGNSCLRLGEENETATLVFEVSENVTSVIIRIAQYKNETTKVILNGYSEELIIETSSNDGLYTEIVIDTTETKIVTLETVECAGRCMIESISLKR